MKDIRFDLIKSRSNDGKQVSEFVPENEDTDKIFDEISCEDDWYDVNKYEIVGKTVKCTKDDFIDIFNPNKQSSTLHNNSAKLEDDCPHSEQEAIKILSEELKKLGFNFREIEKMDDDFMMKGYMDKSDDDYYMSDYLMYNRHILDKHEGLLSNFDRPKGSLSKKDKEEFSGVSAASASSVPRIEGMFQSLFTNKDEEKDFEQESIDEMTDLQNYYINIEECVASELHGPHCEKESFTSINDHLYVYSKKSDGRNMNPIIVEFSPEKTSVITKVSGKVTELSIKSSSMISNLTEYEEPSIVFNTKSKSLKSLKRDKNESQITRKELKRIMKQLKQIRRFEKKTKNAAYKREKKQIQISRNKTKNSFKGKSLSNIRRFKKNRIYIALKKKKLQIDQTKIKQSSLRESLFIN